MRSITSPYYLPQILMPIDLILKKLDDEEVEYKYMRVNPNDLKPLQAFTLSDEVEKAIPNDKNPIWLDNENNILDGHKRMVNALTDNLLLTAIKINMNTKDACRVLNKIQDIYEYEQAHVMEEQPDNAINYYANDAKSGIENSYSDKDFLESLEEDNANLQTEKPTLNKQTIIAYRKEPIKENSVVGNFFTLIPIVGFTGYEIEFDNLLDTNALGVVYKDSQLPIDILAKIWFPHVNFEKLSEQYKIEPVNLKNKAIAEKAMKLNYDGIKYGDKLIQGLK